MSTPFHTVVRNYDIIDSDDYIAFNLASTITESDIGKAVTLDTSAANKVKLAGTDEKIIGRLETVEARGTGLVGTVSIEGIYKLPVQSGQTINLGDTVVGHTSGAVKAAASADWNSNYVIEKISTTHVVVVKK